MEGVRVIGIHGKRTLTTKLGIEMPSGQHVAKGRLSERGGSAHARTIGVCLGFSG